MNLEEYTTDKNIEYKIFRIEGSVDDYIDKKMDKYFKYDGINKIPDKPTISKLNVNDYIALYTSIDPITGGVTAKLEKNTSGGTVLDGAYAAKLLEYQKAQQTYLTMLNANGSYIDGKYSFIDFIYY